MAETFGKCSNFASCGLAYRGQQIRYAGKALCPECGHPLIVTPTGSSSSLALIGVIAGAVILAAVALLFLVLHKTGSTPPSVAQSSTTAPAASANPPKPADVARPPAVVSTPAMVTAPPANVSATPLPQSPTPAPISERPSPPTISAAPTPALVVAPQASPHPLERLIPVGSDNEPVSIEQNIDTDVKREENARVRVEVLKRIDLMPNLSTGDRQKLYTRVDHAHGIGRVITVPFTTGGRAAGAREVEQLKTALKAPEISGLVKIPTVVFVLLGFADKREMEKGNQKFSIDRAENISQTLKEKCGMQNTTLPIGMGSGAELFDSGVSSKSRVVEVWAVVP